MLTLVRYRELFGQPHLAAALFASLTGRLPIGIAGLAILLFVQTTSGSFMHAGTAAALYVLGLAVIAPFVGRLIDRMGPRPILLVCGLVYPVTLVLLSALVWRGASPIWVALTAFIAGSALPPITICVRTMLPSMVRDSALLQTAYSVDSALVEVIFVIGPALVAAFVAVGMPGGAVLLAALTGAVGTALFLRTPAIRQWCVPIKRRAPGWGPLKRSPLLLVFASTLFYSVAFGLFEVAITAYCAARTSPASAGLALALASVGSAGGAIVYGSRTWSLPLVQQFRIALACMAVGIFLVVPSPSLPLLMAVSVLAGAPMATVIAVQSVLISRLAPREMLAETFTWSSSFLLGGISGGIAAGGIAAEIVSAPWIFAAAALATAVAGLIAMALREPTTGRATGMGLSTE
jgi:MFS family permease